MRRQVATLLLTLLALLVTAPAAVADGEDTWANTPGNHAAATFDPGPKNKGEGDPFEDKPKVSIYETYGFGFFEWRAPEVDEGWFPDLPDSAGVVNNAINGLNNFGLVALGFVMGFGNMVLRLSFDPGALNLLNPLMRIGQDVFGERVFMGMFWLTLLVSGIWLVGKARKANFAAVAKDGSWVMFTMLLSFVAIIWPFTVAPVVDQAVTQGMSSVNAQMAGYTGTGSNGTDGAAASIHKALVYETWCSGLIGRDAGEQLADEYCPRFLKASTFSYQELRETADDPEARADLSQEKYDDYQDAAEDLKDDSATAYAHLAGQKPWSRFGVVALAWFGGAAALPFVVIAAALMFYSLVVLRVAMAVLPLVALIAGFPPMKKHMIRLSDYVVAAFVSMMLMGIASAGFMAAIGGLLSPASQTHVAVAYLVLLFLTVVFWAIFKPHKAVRAMMNMRPVSKNVDDTPASDKAAAAADATDPSTGGGSTTFVGADGSTQTAPSGGRWVNATPAEAAPPPSIRREAVKGAVMGAVSTAALGIATGGAATVAGMAAGAARGAGTAMVAHQMNQGGTGTRTLAGAAQLAAARKTNPAEGGARTTLTRTDDAPVTPTRVYLAGEHAGTPAEAAPLVPPSKAQGSTTPVYNIYTGGK